MKQLIIMRHGKSSWDDKTLDDFDRPLNERGIKNAAQMGRFLLQKTGTPDLILCSAAKRTVETAQLAADNLNYPKEKIETDKKLYLVWIDQILKRISMVPNDINSCLLIGHNPGLTELVNYFGVRLDNLPTASAACFEFDVSDWKDVSSEKSRFKWLQMAREL